MRANLLFNNKLVGTKLLQKNTYGTGKSVCNKFY